MRDIAHDDVMAEVFRKDPAYAIEPLNPNQIYRTLSATGNPEMKSLAAILRVMGLRLAIQPIPQQQG